MVWGSVGGSLTFLCTDLIPAGGPRFGSMSRKCGGLAHLPVHRLDPRWRAPVREHVQEAQSPEAMRPAEGRAEAEHHSYEPHLSQV